MLFQFFIILHDLPGCAVVFYYNNLILAVSPKTPDAVNTFFQILFVVFIGDNDGYQRLVPINICDPSGVRLHPFFHLSQYAPAAKMRFQSFFCITAASKHFLGNPRIAAASMHFLGNPRIAAASMRFLAISHIADITGLMIQDLRDMYHLFRQVSGTEQTVVQPFRRSHFFCQPS